MGTHAQTFGVQETLFIFISLIYAPLSTDKVSKGSNHRTAQHVSRW